MSWHSKNLSADIHSFDQVRRALQRPVAQGACGRDSGGALESYGCLWNGAGVMQGSMFGACFDMLRCKNVIMCLSLSQWKAKYPLQSYMPSGSYATMLQKPQEEDRRFVLKEGLRIGGRLSLWIFVALGLPWNLLDFWLSTLCSNKVSYFHLLIIAITGMCQLPRWNLLPAWDLRIQSETFG